MTIVKPAIAGTLESSDVQVSIAPCGGGIDLSVQSTVLAQYGRQIRETVLETLGHMGIENAQITLNDRGALDCTIRARVECAVYRACEMNEQFPWGEAIHP